MKETIIDCLDGSQTMMSERFKELYHSKYGSIQESERVFIEVGFKKILENKKRLEILEIGFGTGLNALLTYNENANQNEIYYTSIEKYPIGLATAEKFNFNQQLKIRNKTIDERIFYQLHSSKWNEWIAFDNFKLMKIEGDLLITQLKKDHFDLVYYDAFAPEAQPELWTAEVFETLYQSMKKNSIMTTYCAKGVVKRNLKSVGFLVESLPGPIGKREITRAIKI
jgi:tRNA U34 5-methylaminomethyl-2-thiouridine-forming methyltransferase MnmC